MLYIYLKYRSFPQTFPNVFVIRTFLSSLRTLEKGVAVINIKFSIINNNFGFLLILI